MDDRGSEKNFDGVHARAGRGSLLHDGVVGAHEMATCTQEYLHRLLHALPGKRSKRFSNPRMQRATNTVIRLQVSGIASMSQFVLERS